MRMSTFNFLVAIWCAGAAAVVAANSANWFLVGINIFLALGNLIIGVMQHKQGN